MRRIAVAVCLGWALSGIRLDAQESLCLKSGFCLQAESHIVADGTMVLQTGSGTLQFPVDQVESITSLPTPASKADPAALISAHSEEQPLTSEELLVQAAIQQGLQPNFVRSVAMVESGLQQHVLSPKGAIGLMQLMPATAGKLGVDPSIARQNALGGATFLRELLLKYKGDSVLTLAAYNAGPAAVTRYKGVPPYLETRRYILKVLSEYQRQQRRELAKATPAGMPPSQVR